MSTVYRPTASQALAGGIGAISVVGLLALLADQGIDGVLRYGPWVVLRVSDPAQANASPGPAGHPCNDWAVAYSSPGWLRA